MAAALRVTDPALLHYRSGAFFLERARQGGVTSALRDVLLGVVAATEDPIAGGRHKVFGSKRLAVIPQTSTIASHLPRALGVALSLQRSRRLGVEGAWPSDAVTVCSFGDASANHSTATGAINAAIQAGYQGIPMPLAPRLRGQRHRSQCRHTRRLDPRRLRKPARAGVRRGRRLRPGRQR